MLLGKNIDGDTIKSLIDGKVRESVHLEFKRETYGNTDADKKEFLKDISAFANTLGGHLIIGIGENEGGAASVEPILESVDKESDRLQNMARTGIEPPILGLDIKPIDIDDKNIIIIHVPRSFNPPHRVIYKGSNRYYGRNSSSVHQLSLEELRQAFGERRSIEERAKSFVGQRFLSIQANDGIMPLPEKNGTLVMHLVPLLNFGMERRIDVVKIKELQEAKSYFNRIESPGWGSQRINLEGYCIYHSDTPCQAYTQIFHNGVVEATSTSLFKRYIHPAPTRRDRSNWRFFSGYDLPLSLIEAINDYMQGLHALEIMPPILLQISMMGIKGIEMGIKLDDPYHVPPSYERDVLHLPSSVITEFRADEDYESVMAEQMHFLWNAFGFERCNLFNENDEWAPPN